ncbi:MAG: OprO/OprP family phosphate-selective porin [Parabacteroides sp.]|nr:OprO/OprP family phosphate-selective porin [Parabacteroides sp.]
MKTHLYLLALFISVPSVFAQEVEEEADPGQEPTLVERFTGGKKMIENAEMNFQFFTSANANFTGSNFDGANFKLNRVRLQIKGTVWKNFSYHYRQSFNKYADPYSLDNLSSSLELANVNLKVHDKFNFTIGKQYVNFGGYEYYVNSLKVREFSEFNNVIPCYQAGISGNWLINPDHELRFQIVNNRSGQDNEIYVTGLPENTRETKMPFMYTVNWSSYYFDRILQLHYAAAMGQQAQKRYSYYLTGGNTIEKGPLLAYLDIMYTRQGLDQHGIISRLPETAQTACNTEYLSFIADVDYRFHPRWNVYVKGAYETGRIYKENGPFAKGLYRRSWNAQSSLEFYPIKNCDLFLFLLYTYRGVKLEKTALDMGAVNPDTHRISLGLVYSIPVF